MGYFEGYSLFFPHSIDYPMLVFILYRDIYSWLNENMKHIIWQGVSTLDSTSLFCCRLLPHGSSTCPWSPSLLQRPTNYLCPTEPDTASHGILGQLGMQEAQR